MKMTCFIQIFACVGASILLFMYYAAKPASPQAGLNWIVLFSDSDLI